jgi:putative inorganic carbon (HCO3(-)) transporter
MLSPRLLLPAVILASVVALVRWIATGRLIVRTPADWPILLILLLVPMALWVAIDREAAMPQALRLVLGVLLFYSVAHATEEPGQRRALAIGLTGVGVLLALAAPFVTELPGLTTLARLAPAEVAGSVNPNVLAGALLLAMAFPLSALLFYHRGQSLGAVLVAALSVAVLLTVLALTRSRGAVMGLVAMVLVLAACRWHYGWLLAPAALIGVILLIEVSGPGALLDAPISAGSIGGMDLRLEIWSRAKYALEDFPLTGIGIGNFGQVVNLLYPLFLIGTDTVVTHAHNLYLQVGLDLGLIGLSAWLAVCLLALAGAWSLWRKGRARGDIGAAALGAALVAAQAAVGVHGLTDAIMWSAAPAVLLWAVWGLALGAREGQRSGVDPNI